MVKVQLSNFHSTTLFSGYFYGDTVSTKIGVEPTVSGNV
jgi:hypothetical protein